jgi:MFS family permease
MIGPFLATLLLLGSGQLAALGWQWPFLLYGLTFPIGLLGFFYLFEPERRFKRDIAVAATPFPWIIVAVVCSVTVLTSIIYFVQPIQFSLVLREIGVKDPAMIGRISSIASLAVPLGALIFRRNVQRKIQFQMMLVFLLMGVGLVGVGLSHDYRLSAAAAVFQQTAAGMTVPILIAWALGLLPLEHRGRGMGLWASSFFVGQFISPLAVSTFRGLLGGLLPAVTLFGVICLVAAGISLAISGRGRTNQAVEGTS